jgi:hypothetical protein
MIMRLSPNPIEPVHKQRRVALEPSRAFDLFTRSMASWWPLGTHSIAEERAADIRFEGRVGGRVVEITNDGSEHEWADVIAWDPPHRFVLAWHPNPEPTAATIVDVRVTALPDGGTQLDLEHRAWEELGDEAGPAARAGYLTGWDGVLDDFERVLAEQFA